MISKLIRVAMVASIGGSALVASAATMTGDPYVPGQGRDKIAADLGIPAADILVDRRCVYTRTEHWVAQAEVKTMSTCTVLATPTRLILANYNSGTNGYVVDLSFDYSKIKSVALSTKNGFRPSLELDGKKEQVQLETDQGFISVSAWRGPPKVKPFDARGSVDIFEALKDKGIEVSEPKGLVEVELSSWTLFRRK